MTPLHYAAKRCLSGIVILLIKQNVNVNCSNSVQIIIFKLGVDIIL